MTQTVLAEGKTKVILDNGHGEVLIRSKDDITAGDGERHELLTGKAACSTRTTCNVFALLMLNDIPTHYRGHVDDVTFRARRVRMIQLELVVRRIATGSYLKRHPDVQADTLLDDLVFEIFEKDDANHDPLMEFDFQRETVRRYDAKLPLGEGLMSETPLAVTIYSGVSPTLLERLQEIAIRTFLVLEAAWASVGGTLFDFKVECGYDAATGQLLLADVIDNDSWRLRFGQRTMDKQLFRDGEASLPEIKLRYEEVADLSAELTDSVYSAPEGT
ncbi:MAG TPA: phosphoribosylaminoimidazolesuccinocarboxamide synthase [Verrucomicrobiae bacterium]|nr:phosphoribosylaminoimidazolesuccinocarboxamide synthase [Verrucomicrobiae bacterium]